MMLSVTAVPVVRGRRSCNDLSRAIISALLVPGLFGLLVVRGKITAALNGSFKVEIAPLELVVGKASAAGCVVYLTNCDDWLHYRCTVMENRMKVFVVRLLATTMITRFYFMNVYRPINITLGHMLSTREQRARVLVHKVKAGDHCCCQQPNDKYFHTILHHGASVVQPVIAVS